MSKALEAIHSRPVGSKPFASRSLSVKALEAIHPSQVGQTFLTSRHVKALAATHSPPAPNPSCAAVDACMSPCHDATIQNPQIALVNVESVVLQLTFFFPRVRTPCGHGAQVIVEGREEQSDGGEKNKDNQHNPKPNKPQPTGRVSTIM